MVVWRFSWRNLWHLAAMAIVCMNFLACATFMKFLSSVALPSLR